MTMTLKEFYRKEKYIALHAQSRRFRIVKYCVLLASQLAFMYGRVGLPQASCSFCFFSQEFACISFSAGKPKPGQSPGGFTSAFLSKGNNPAPLPPPFQRSGLHVLNVPGKNTEQGEFKMNAALLFLHLVGLMLGAAGGFASAVIMRRALVLARR